MKTKTLLLVLFLITAIPAWSATTPSSGTLAGVGQSITWSGGPLTGSNLASTALGDPIASLCLSLGTCETFTLVVNLPATFYTTNPNAGVQISINWGLVANDLDLYLLDSHGNIMYSSAQLATNSEFVDAGRLVSGTYTVLVTVGAEAAATTYTGTATLLQEPSVPSGRARYTRGNFVFNTTQQLQRPNDPANILGGTNSLLLFVLDQDVEPRVVHHALGHSGRPGRRGHVEMHERRDYLDVPWRA